MTTDAERPLLRVRDLKTHFTLKSGGLFSGTRKVLKAVDGVSFDLAPGEVLGIVGESGCGKSTVGRTLTRLEDATGGTAEFDGREMLSLSKADFRPLRREIQMIFQDPFASLNPRLTIEQTLAEPVRIHGLETTREAIRERIARTLTQVGLDPKVMTRHPHEFSGGQRQRIGIARVMIVEPKLVIADEAVSALDVSIQAQVLNLIKDLQTESGISMLFISHDLGVVRHICDRVAVMYLGRIVETAPKATLFSAPSHPYTKLLLASIPRIRPGRVAAEDRGEPASAAAPPPGCPFHPRCGIATDICRSERPLPVDLGNGQFSACHHAGKQQGEAA
jgi:oligopeptide/dipeptide ABC transporter ATP-binding protein